MELKKNIEPGKIKEIPELLDRRGKFRISHTLMQDNPEAIKKIMAHMIVTRCEYMFNSDAHYFDYMALSDLFNKVEPGYMAPEYFILVNKDGEISARRIHTTPHHLNLLSIKEIKRREGNAAEIHKKIIPPTNKE